MSRAAIVARVVQSRAVTAANAPIMHGGSPTRIVRMQDVRTAEELKQAIADMIRRYNHGEESVTNSVTE